MFLLNQNPAHGHPLDSADAEALSVERACEVERFLTYRINDTETPLHVLPSLATAFGVAAVAIKDEGYRLGLGSFKALGGSYAVIRLVLEEASRQLGRPVDVADLQAPEVRQVAAGMTFACATDGNHGRSVAQGAQLVGARAVIFVHALVSQARVAAIAHFGAEVVRVAGTYDASVEEAARVAEREGWIPVSDTSWAGYERIPLLVMQGYTAMIREALRQLETPPTHVFVQAGVGGVAAAVAGYLALALGEKRPTFIVVEPALAACIFATAEAGHPIRIPDGEATVMAMLECREPSPVAWRVLSRAADAFMTVEDEEAVAAMNRLARPEGGDPAIVAGESGGAGVAGFIHAASDPAIRAAIGLDARSRVLLFNTEGATDAQRYRELVGLAPSDVVPSDVVPREARA
jgi:diaminopropionate ammonia-lyase